MKIGVALGAALLALSACGGEAEVEEAEVGEGVGEGVGEDAIAGEELDEQEEGVAGTEE